MGHGSTGNGPFVRERNYNTLPQKDEKPLFYSEGDNPEKVLEFVHSLTDDNRFYVEDYDRGMMSINGSVEGSEVIEELEIEPEDGYAFAIYNAGENPSLEENTEVYAAFSDALPRNITQYVFNENPKMIDGTLMSGVDENLDTEELWEKARDSGMIESRIRTKGNKIFRTLFAARFK